MAASAFASMTNGLPLDRQWIFVVRHGDRWDYSHPSWKENNLRVGDPPLSDLGHEQARETGAFLDRFLAQHQISAKDITCLSSPFLRCIQTSTEMLSSFQTVDKDDNIAILPECGVWEMDCENDKWHESLPQSMTERQYYFPRVDASYESIFVPTLPESRKDFLKRCERFVEKFNERYPYKPNTAIIIVTHAAACVGLSKAAASHLSLSEINAAHPCSIFGLWRSENSPQWNLDDHRNAEGWNGAKNHVTNLGRSTLPWHNFGSSEDPQRGYSGPPKVTESKEK